LEEEIKGRLSSGFRFFKNLIRFLQNLTIPPIPQTLLEIRVSIEQHLEPNGKFGTKC